MSSRLPALVPIPATHARTVSTVGIARKRAGNAAFVSKGVDPLPGAKLKVGSGGVGENFGAFAILSRVNHPAYPFSGPHRSQPPKMRQDNSLFPD